MNPIPIILGTVIGVILGWLLATLLGKSSAKKIEHELRAQVRLKDEELIKNRAYEASLIASEAAAVNARATLEVRASEISDKLNSRENEIVTINEKFLNTANALSKANADLDAARNIIAEKDTLYARQLGEAKQAQEKALVDLRDTFKALSADALRANAPEFLQLATASFAKLQEAAKGDLAQRQEAIVGLLKPIETQLNTYQERLQQSATNQSNTLGEVRKQLETLTKQSESLASETERFRMVLKSNQARGQWGEETLRRVVEAAGMSSHCDFEEQVQEGDKKPDMVVRLPGDRVIIVDAKVPDLEFIQALDTADLEKRTRLLEAHASKLKDTIRDLARKNYPEKFKNALDYVILFIPAESLFSAALEGDRDLIVWAAQQRIMLATPASFIALLRSVSISWQQHEQTENAREISKTAQELYTRISTFIDHFEKIRSSLSKANEAYNDAVGSYERMVRPSGERLLKLGIASGLKELADIQPTESVLRQV